MQKNETNNMRVHRQDLLVDFEMENGHSDTLRIHPGMYSNYQRKMWGDRTSSASRDSPYPTVHLESPTRKTRFR